MQVHVGDWLILNDRSQDQPGRRAVILAVRDEGHPPFTVRWLDDGREALVFPGVDSQVVSREQQAARYRGHAELLDDGRAVGRKQR